MVEEQIIRDENGNIIYESHGDGFVEESIYENNHLVRQVTKYPNGITEVDHYALPKEDE